MKEFFCKNRENQLFPVSVYFKPIFSLDYEFAWSAVMTKIITNLKYILINHGKINK